MRLFKKKRNELEVHSDDIRVVELLKYHGVKTIMDIGANRGQYATRMRMAGFTGHIISFEPLSHNYALLKEKSSNDSKWTIASPMALSRRKGKATIHISQADDLSSLLSLGETVLKALPTSRIIHEEIVIVEKLDDIWDDFISKKMLPVFVKVDTQGFELPILQGAENLVQNKSIIGFQLELSLTPLYNDESTFEEIILWLKHRGYNAHFISQGYFSKRIMRLLQVDGVFFCK